MSSVKARLQALGFEEQDMGLFILPYTGVGFDMGGPDIEAGLAMMSGPVEEMMKLLTPPKLTDEEKLALEWAVKKAEMSAATMQNWHVFANTLQGLLNRLG